MRAALLQGALGHDRQSARVEDSTWGAGDLLLLGVTATCDGSLGAFDVLAVASLCVCVHFVPRARLQAASLQVASRMCKTARAI